MGDLLLTGYPGFLGTALLPRLLRRDPAATAFCLVQARFARLAAERVRDLATAEPHTAGRIVLVPGDITEPGLGLSRADRARLDAVAQVWHLAAVYDLAVARDLAHRVNVTGTRNVLALCGSLGALTRLQYVSTCYVGGSFDGVFHEDDLEVGQSLQNHYESTKLLAEADVRAAARRGLPVTVYRPGIVVGDSTSGETQKYDGPYYLARLLMRQAKVAMVPRVADPDRVRFTLVPRDYVVDAMDALVGMPGSVGRTYALADPEPPTVRELVDTFARLLDRTVVWAPVPLGLVRAAVGLPGVSGLVKVPAESLDYFALPTRFDTTNARTDLAGTGVDCPPFAAYAATLLRFMQAHPDVPSAAMV